MEGRDVLGAIGVLAGADVAGCDRDALALLVRLLRFVRAWLDALETRIAARAGELAGTGACESPTALLGDEGRQSERAAQTAARRATLCQLLPAFGDALAAGVVSAGHVDALAQVARQLDDTGRAELVERQDDLVAAAARAPVDEFARECRDLGRVLSRDEGKSRQASLRQQRRVRRWINHQTGMHATLIELDPESDAKAWAAIHDAMGTERSKRQDPDTNWDHLKADTVVNLLTGARGTDQRRPEVSVLIDLETLQHGLHDDTVSETSDGIPLPPDVVRRMACDAGIVPVVLNGKGEVLDVGKSQRLATRRQRNALKAMYSTCGFPGCTVPVDACRVHHVVPWEHGGPTDLDNLLPLCEGEHHHRVHEGGWQLSLRPDRTVTIHRPDGTFYFEGNTTNRTPRHQAA